MTPTDAKPFSLADFMPFLKSLEGSEDEAAVIGGMAVSSWAERLLEEEEQKEFDLPLYSKDLDLRGNRLICMMLAQQMQMVGAEMTGLAAATRKAAPHMGKIHAAGIRWRGHRTTIEVLERLPGLDSSANDPPVGTHLKLWGGIPILDPCSLFICKLNAANTRPGEGANNDINHLRILARVIPRFLTKIRETALPEYDAKEDAERLLRQIEACGQEADDFRVPLLAAELEPLVTALRAHVG